MATDKITHDELLRLNALVDGELAPGEHAALAARLVSDREFARAYATLARLKACVVENADAAPTVSITMPAAAKRSWRRPVLQLGAAAAAAGGLMVLFALTNLPPHRQPAPILMSAQAAITLAALPQTPVIPDLEVAGLRLAGATIDMAGQSRVLVATYLGPRGCRLELRVRPEDSVSLPAEGTDRRAWTVGGLAYELVAYGMPAARFAAISEAAERMTRDSRFPNTVDRRLREARVAAPPCLA